MDDRRQFMPSNAAVPLPAETESIATRVLDAAFAVHRALGPGLLEGVYETCLAHEIGKLGLVVKRQVAVPVVYDGLRMEVGLRLDMLVEDSVIVEIKAIDALLSVHTAQLLTYLKVTRLRLGLLINFNVALLRNGIRRVIR